MKILVLRTSGDATIQNLFQKLYKIDPDNRIDCLIQKSQIIRYQETYKYINFIDICGERFENIPSEVVKGISDKKYDELYITLSGVNGYNFWNVMELIKSIGYRRAFFYNCNGERVEIPKKNVVQDIVCRLYIKWVRFIYR